MHPPATRVIYDDRPYLVVVDGEGSVTAAYGPFAPGTEPSMTECGPDTQVDDAALVERLRHLIPISPELPVAEDTLAGS